MEKLEKLQYHQGQGWDKSRFIGNGINILVKDAIPVGPPVIATIECGKSFSEIDARDFQRYENRGANAYTLSRWSFPDQRIIDGRQKEVLNLAVQFYRISKTSKRK